MKQFYLTLIGAMFLTTANAAQNSNGLLLDSTYTTTADGLRTFKTIYEYNDAKQGTVELTYDYLDATGKQMAEPKLINKLAITYDSDGRRVKTEEYEYEGAKSNLVSVSEYSGFDALGRPAQMLMKAIPENGTSTSLQDYMKIVITKYYGDTDAMEEYETFMCEEGSWYSVGVTKCEFNANGTVAKSTQTMSMMGFTISSITTYEYDSHYGVTKCTLTSDMGVNSTIIYENEYDAAGNLIKVKETSTSVAATSTSYTYYFWGNGGTATAVTLAAVARKMAKGCYTIGGYRHDKPNGKGLYIIDGKKVVVK